jgi:hypothetical protein
MELELKMYSHALHPTKLALIDRALEMYEIHSILDLGACWGVHGGYTFHALDNGDIWRAFIVDGNITEPTKERKRNYSQLTLLQGELGNSAFVSDVKEIDAIIMYDILLHQVSPDWIEFIKMWGAIAKVLIIYNQNWLQEDNVVRFVDRDVEWFIKNVPHTNAQSVREWYKKHEQWNADAKRKWKDVHWFWQWGIPREKLKEAILAQGFRIDYDQVATPWSREFPWVSNDCILASKP